MSRGALLIPNLGAEESANWRELLREAAPATMARLWSLLFAAEARVDPPELRASWPIDLAPASGPAFSWLEDSGNAVAWFPTEDARNSAQGAGCELTGPAPEAALRVHDKAFAQRSALRASLVPRPLAGLIEIFEVEELRDADASVRRIRAHVEAWPEWTGQRFTLKPRLATSGRGRVPGDGHRFDEGAIRGALPRLARRGGALLEPWLERTQDLSVQLHLGEDGALTLLGTLEQLLSTSGLYRGHRGVVDWRGRVSSGSRHEQALLEAASELARCAAAEGFHGPCGLDAFVFRIEEPPEPAREIFRPVTEFNARFTTGTIVLGLVRRALPALGLQPGDTRPFEFVLNSATSPAAAEARVFRLGQEADPVQPELRIGVVTSLGSRS